MNEVRTREDFVAAARALRGDFLSHPERWENHTIDEYLESLAAWTQHMDGYFANRGKPTPEPSWSLLAEVLRAGSVYE